MSTSRNVIDANMANFQNAVIGRSHQQPVLVDFWAPWCGPCRMLGPVLERLAVEYNGRFLLAKVNSDTNQPLSQQYQVRGIPAVKAFVDGRVVAEFVGAQPEPMVRQFIEGVVAQKPVSARPPAAKTEIPATPDGRLAQAQELLRAGNGCEALPLLPAGDSAAADQLRPLAQYLCDSRQGRLAGNDAQISGLIQRREYSGALYSLLVEMNQHNNGRARAVIQGLFTLLGPSDPIVKAYAGSLKAA